MKFTRYRGSLYCHALKIHQLKCSKPVTCELLKRKVSKFCILKTRAILVMAFLWLLYIPLAPALKRITF